MKPGIVGKPAPELQVTSWIDGHGLARAPLKLADLGADYKILFFYQHWCPGCHLHGFPALKRMVNHLSDHGVEFAVIQTVFEGYETNTFEKVLEDQRNHHIHLPFGHDVPVDEEQFSQTVTDYAPGGTPWFVVIDPQGIVIFNDFQLNFKEFLTLVKHKVA